MLKFQFLFDVKLILLLPVFILQVLHPVSAIRKDVRLRVKHSCRTTVQGRFFLADDNGHVCSAMEVDPLSHCCPRKRDQFSCYGCNLVSRCCNSYEYCVSCCLNPAMTHKELALNVKIAKPVTAGTYESVFDYCIGRCRHNSDAICWRNEHMKVFLIIVLGGAAIILRVCGPLRNLEVHENAYLSEFHHCFSIPSNSSESSSTKLDPRLAGINVIIGRQGESCDSVCKYNGQSCVPNKLSLLNQCEIMQKYMSCKGACLESIGADQPAEVVDDAPRHLNPGACLYTKTQATLSCDGLHRHTRRLCPCA